MYVTKAEFEVAASDGGYRDALDVLVSRWKAAIEVVSEILGSCITFAILLVLFDEQGHFALGHDHRIWPFEALCDRT